ncbi:Glutaminase [Frankliniella fusca]|uniref:Glutaminase n=1 Tax=Frankliniella fusca TaxID=407009 RepID=A0AAE1HXD3_9NEOP|nr:Glutaminase [Frankliniella fusca]
MKGDYKEVRRSVYREKHKVWPNIPKTNDEVQAFLQKAFEEKSIKTSTGELFLYLSEKGLHMFTFQSNLRLMAHCTSLMGDGTFDKATKHTYQLYTIHGYLDGFHIPLAFFPLKGKSQELYTEVWNLILKEADLIRSFVCPYAILFDFELEAHNAVRDPTNFGKNCNVKGCRFHFSQNLTKKIRGEPVLRTAYDKKQSGEMGDSNNEDDIPERKWLLRFLGLSCLPPQLGVGMYTPVTLPSEEESTDWEPESDSGGESEPECHAQEPEPTRTRPALATRPTPAAQTQLRTQSAAASAEATLTGGRPKRLRK